jgi:antitoxin CcdA
MESQAYDIKAPKKAANLSINGDLLRRARALNLNLSRLLEARLAEVVRQAQREQWLEDSRAALEDYNTHIEREGAFSDGLRSF